MDILNLINLICIPLNAYLVGTSETDIAKAVNAGAVVLNLAIVASKLVA